MSKETALDFVGILPAAGIASRLSPCRYLKELLPVAFDFDEESGATIPLPVVALSLRAMAAASIRRCVVTISDRKPELLRYLGDGGDFGVSLAYVQQTIPSGLAAAVDLAKSWVNGAYSCLLLPDTIVTPSNAISNLRQMVEREPCDLALAILPTAHPEQLGPVRFASNGVVQEVSDKPAKTDLKNTWGGAIWSPQFSRFLHDSLLAQGTAVSLGAIFNQAIQQGMSARALWFPAGQFDDIGTFKGISQALGRTHLEGRTRMPLSPQSLEKVAALPMGSYL